MDAPTLPPGEIEQVGEYIIREYCPQYDKSTSSYTIPPFFNSTYTEGRDITDNEIEANQRGLSTAQEKRRLGLTRGQSGELSEYKIFSLFHELKELKLSEQLIFIRNFDLDNKNSHKIKEKQTKKEIPNIDLSRVDMSKEIDGLVIVRNLGAIVLEVKSSAREDNITKAEVQLRNGKAFVDSLMGAIQGKKKAKIPCAKVIFIPGEKAPSPVKATPTSCFQFHEDRLKDFQSVWDEIIQCLRQRSPKMSFTSAEFKKFTRLCLGIWCITPKKRGFIFERHEASPGHQIGRINENINQQAICSDYVKNNEKKISDPVNNVVYCEHKTLFRNCKEIGVVYATPEQKEIFNNHPCAIIRAGAGSGKTYLTLYKVIDIIDRDKNANVLMIVPPPHDQRCKKILKQNGIDSTIIQHFTFLRHNTAPSVFIISLKNFFHVTPDEIREYNVSDFHIFMDDMQSYRPLRQDPNVANYGHILTFLDEAYKSATSQNQNCTNNQKRHVWCCVDVPQSSCHFKDDDSSANLFYEKNGRPRIRSIPMVHLTKVLRNSREVQDLMGDVHRQSNEARVKGNWVDPHMSFGEMQPGHCITSAPVVYQKLIKGSPLHSQLKFVLMMLEDELNLLFGAGTSLKFSDLAILYEQLDDEALKQETDKFFHEKYNVTTQSIEESIITDNKDAVVFDSYLNAMSYEVACVIFICQVSLTVPYYGPYVVTSRARARLTFIDYDVTKPPFAFIGANVTVVNWRYHEGGFEKC